MQVVAVAFFIITAVLSAVLLPNTFTLIPLFEFSIARATTLVLALLFWVAAGRVDNWSSSRFLSAIFMIIGTAALVVGCLMIQMTRDDNVPAPMPMVYRVAAGLLPACLMASALLGSRRMFLIVSALAPLAGFVVLATWKPLNEYHLAHLPKSKEQREHDELFARRMPELDSIPTAAGPEALIRFVKPDELYEVVTKAMNRIEQTPDWIARLAVLLDGENRLQALYVLTRRMGQLPQAVVERCWRVALSVARDRAALQEKGVAWKESDQRMLLDSVAEMGGQSEQTRLRHWKELAEMLELLRAAKAPLSGSQLDLWVLHNEVLRIPKEAGIVPLLKYTGLDEFWGVRREVMDRIAKDPESTAKLAKLLDGPHRLDALVVMADRSDELSQELREHCWRAAAITAKEMADRIEQGKPPTPFEVRKMSDSARIIWGKLDSDPAPRIADLITMRNVVLAAADQYEKAAFGWSDVVLAKANRESTAGGPK